MQSSEVKLISIDQIKAGDVLLCRNESKLGLVSRGIKLVTNSEYSHAAICLDRQTAAEAVGSGVTMVQIDNLLRRYCHVAVFRQPDAWTEDRILAMKAFIDRIVSINAKYNHYGVMNFYSNSKAHGATLMEKLHAFFDAQIQTLEATDKSSYFCSELVASCFVVSGFIEPSAAIIYQPDVMSPGALGRDPTFGTFFGYASANQNYVVPRSDEFYNTPKFTEIFGAL